PRRSGCARRSSSRRWRRRSAQSCSSNSRPHAAPSTSAAATWPSHAACWSGTRMPDTSAAQQWQKRPEAGGRFARWLLRTLAFRLGRPVARFITFFAAFYFMVRRSQERAASRDYLQRVLGRRATFSDVYRHFLWFSTVTLDRLYLMADRFSRFDVKVA